MTRKLVLEIKRVMVVAVYRVVHYLIAKQHRSGKLYPSRSLLKGMRYCAERKHPEAMYELGLMLYEHGASQADKRWGLEYLRAAAKAGVAEAQYQIGLISYENSTSPAEEHKAAAHWFALAAENHHPLAAEKLEELKQAKKQAATRAELS